MSEAPASHPSVSASPLRYPGGKQRLAHIVRDLMEANGLLGGTYVEPYAGGAGIAIRLLLAGHVRRVYINDSSRCIYAFWQALVDHPQEMIQRVHKVELTVDEWRRQRQIVQHPASFSTLDVGFATLFLNRCNRSGVLAAGLIGGLRQAGPWRMDARFPREALARRIAAIAHHRDRVFPTNMDAEEFITRRVSRLGQRTLVYLDPPYYRKSKRLYLDAYHPNDHARLAGVIQSKLMHKWILSYDAVPEVLHLYRGYPRRFYQLRYTAANRYLGDEVMFFSKEVVVPAGCMGSV